MPKISDYLSVAQAAAVMRVSRQRVMALLAEGRMPGAAQLAGRWVIPRATAGAYQATGKKKRGRKPLVSSDL